MFGGSAAADQTAACRYKRASRSAKAAAILDAYTAECLNKVLLKVKHLRGRFGK